MPKFRFIVQASSGKVRKGTITEKDETAARQKLENAGFQVMTLVETPDLVVHTPGGGKLPTGRPVPERADLIDFEEDVWDRFTNFLQVYLLRREVAMILAVAGFAWLVAGAFSEKKTSEVPSAQYVPCYIRIEVDMKPWDGNTMEVSLPEIPFTKVEEVTRNSEELKVVEIDIEALTVPEQITVTILDGKTPIATAEGLLETSGEGRYTYSPELTKVTPKDPR